MNVLIVEDEPRAANRLARLIAELQPDVEVLGKLPSIAATLAWLDSHPAPDLVFMDVRLEDGDCFEILARREIETPIVFCTAYSEYALRAFGANSIDYLLKPVLRDALARALAKYARFSGYRMASGSWPEFPAESADAEGGRTCRRQFLVALAGRFTPVPTDDVVAAGSYLKGTRLIDASARAWVLDESLSEVERALDPELFLRVSRQWLVRVSAVEALRREADGYAIELAALDETIRVSRARVRALKARLAA